MPWVMVAGAVISGVIGASSASRERRAQQRAQAEQNRFREREIAIAERQAEIGDEVYRNSERRFGGVLDRIGQEAALPVDPQYERVSADVAQSFDAQRGASRRNMARFGINPADGAYANEEMRSRNAEALAAVSGREQARRGAAQQRFSNMMSAGALGTGQAGAAAGYMANAAGTFANAANAAGQQADRYGQSAAQTAQATSGMAMDVFNAFRASRSGAPSGSGFSGAGSTGYGGGAAWTPGSTVGGSGTGPSQFGTNWPSSEKLKQGIRPTDTAESAQIIRETPIKDWRYNTDPGKQKVGPIAEESPAAISDGKSVDPQNMVGTLWGGMQELMKRIDQLEQAIGRPMSIQA